MLMRSLVIAGVLLVGSDVTAGAKPPFPYKLACVTSLATTLGGPIACPPPDGRQFGDWCECLYTPAYQGFFFLQGTVQWMRAAAPFTASQPTDPRIWTRYGWGTGWRRGDWVFR
jgi:hypothetical protein